MKFKVFVLLVVLALLWGPAFLFMKVAVHEVPPITMVTVRVGLAALILYAILRFRGYKLPAFGSIWKHFTVVGLLYNATPYVLLTWGEQYIDSAIAAILIGTTPLFTMVFAHLFTTNEHFTPTKVTGVTLGFGGLIILVIPELITGVQATTWGLLAGVIAAASYGGAIVYAQKTLRGQPPLVGPTAQLITATIFLLPLSLVFERPYALPIPSWPAASSVLMLAVFSTALAFFVYYRAMEITNATTLSMIAYLIPIVATVLGVVVLAERPGWNAYLGCGLILLGVVVVNGLIELKGRRSLRHAIAKL